MPQKRPPRKNQLFIWDYSKAGRPPRKRMVGTFDVKTGTWTKNALDGRRHLALIAGRTPAWDAETYNALGMDLKFLVAHTTDGMTFRTSREVFDAHRFEKDFGFGRQYFLEYRYWSVIQTHQTNLWEAI